MLSNTNMQDDLYNFLITNGVKQKYVAEKLGVSSTTICLFLKGQLELSQHKLQKIDELINGKKLVF